MSYQTWYPCQHRSDRALLFSDILYNVSNTENETKTAFDPVKPAKYPSLDLDWLAEHLELASILKCLVKTA
jgi:hypothetical protein